MTKSIRLLQENPAKITRVRYLLRYSVTRGRTLGDVEFKHPKVLEQGYLKDRTFKQTVSEQGNIRQRYIKIFESEEDLIDWSRAKTKSIMGGVQKTYVHGSIQAFIGSINSLKLSSSGGGGAITGMVTSAARIWSTGNMNQFGGYTDVDNKRREAMEELHKLKMKEYKAFTRPARARGVRGKSWKAREETVPIFTPPVALTPKGLEVFRTKRGALYHQTEGGHLTYHRHTGSKIYGAKWTTHKYRAAYKLPHFYEFKRRPRRGR